MKAITDFINGEVIIDDAGYFWIKDSEGGVQMLAQMEVRGWGAIQNMFPMTIEGQEAAAKFQDQIGEFIAAAINEKMEREGDGKGI